MAADATVIAAMESVERPSEATRARISGVQDDGMLAASANEPWKRPAPPCSGKLGLEPSPDLNRRVLAVLTLLRG
jgi:hypothetical protein